MSGENGTDVRAMIRQARGRFLAMAAAYALGAFNDNFFKQAVLLLAVGAGMSRLQAIVIVVFTLPFILLAAPAGWLADRFPRRTVVIASKALELAAMVCGAIALCLSDWTLMVSMVGVLGVQAAVFSPALNGSIPDLYPASHVVKANGRVKLAVTAAILLGTSLAGSALNQKSRLADGATLGQATAGAVVVLVAAAGLLAALGVPKRPAADAGARFPWTGLVDTAAELNRIRKDSFLAVVLSADVFIWFVGALQIPLINQMAGQEFGLDEASTSRLIAAELVGLAVGGLLSGRIASGPRWHRVLPPACLGLALCTGLVAVAPALAPQYRMPALLAMLAAAGVFGGLVMIPCEAFIQVRPPAKRRGAVIAAANAAAFVGILLSGAVYYLLERCGRAPSCCFLLLAGVSGASAVALASALRKHHD